MLFPAGSLNRSPLGFLQSGLYVSADGLRPHATQQPLRPFAISLAYSGNIRIGQRSKFGVKFETWTLQNR
jgi:hypothetical protein